MVTQKQGRQAATLRADSARSPPGLGLAPTSIFSNGLPVELLAVSGKPAKCAKSFIAK